MPLAERLRCAEGLWKITLLFAIAVGGIYSGFMSPTEFGRRRSLCRDRHRVCDPEHEFGVRCWSRCRKRCGRPASCSSSSIGAFLFSYFIVLTQLPNAVTGWVQGLVVAPWVVMVIMVTFYVVLGCFLDAISMILITVPVFLPLAQSLGYDGVWFGILVLVAVEVGMITPPVGLNIFVVRAQMPDIALGRHLSRHRAIPGRAFRADRAADPAARPRAMAARCALLNAAVSGAQRYFGRRAMISK